MLLEGKNILKDFYEKNDSKVQEFKFIELSGKNPLNEVTTFIEGIPKYLVCYLIGNFELNSNDTVVFDVKDWYPAEGDYHIYLVDTVTWRETYSRIYVTSIIVLVILIILTSVFYIKKLQMNSTMR